MKSRDAGVTLIEVLISIIIVGIITIAVLSTMSSAFKLNNDAELSTQAAFLAQDKLDALRLLDPATLPTSGQDNSTVTSNNRSYSVTVRYCVTSSYCLNKSRDVTIEISANNKLLFTGETVFTQVKVN
ncbi:prepilin-type N-terminal cleavage/methylation domain-containing protein (plasmid) [Deinococcus radiomollis]|uniref:type IV pilus modification PilV family protein n=1 Tax=Deinococcus radiomollis TaxID=468916 RepID=UPI00389220F4